MPITSLLRMTSRECTGIWLSSMTPPIMRGDLAMAQNPKWKCSSSTLSAFRPMLPVHVSTRCLPCACTEGRDDSHEHVKISKCTRPSVLDMRDGLVHDAPDGAPGVEDIVAHPPCIAKRSG